MGKERIGDHLMSAKTNRRDFLRNAGIAAAGTAGVAAVPALMNRTEAAQQVTIQYWNGWTEEAAKKITGLCNNFTKANPSIAVKDVVVPGTSADLNAKLLASVAAGNPPDVVTFFGAGNLYTMADQSSLIPLDSVASPKELAQMKAWVAPAVWDLGTYKGKTYGIAQWAQSWALIWNKTEAQQAGLDVNKGIQSLADLQRWAQKLTKYDSHGNITQLGFYDNWIDRWLPSSAASSPMPRATSRQITPTTCGHWNTWSPMPRCLASRRSPTSIPRSTAPASGQRTSTPS
jgi:ABC-type glycerol-3-phosphate transport system substrate-binding protein